MASISKRVLSESTAGRLIAVSATSSPGTTIHTAVAGLTDIDEVNLFAVNTSTSDVLLSIEYGNTGTAHKVDFVIPGRVGLVEVITKLVLQDGAVIRAFADTPNVLNIGGYVNRITGTADPTNTIYDAKGDIVVATADNTVSRLPVGATNGYVLTVDSAESTGVKWAEAGGGGMSLIDSQTFTSSTTYTMPAGALVVVAEVVSGGGGGGGGAKVASGAVGGGAGGNGGMIYRDTYSAAQLGASVTVTVGAGGVGANGATSNGGYGGNGGLGGASRFGPLSVIGGMPGAGGYPNTGYSTGSYPSLNVYISMAQSLGRGGAGQETSVGDGWKGAEQVAAGGGGGAGVTSGGVVRSGAAGGAYEDSISNAFTYSPISFQVQTGGGAAGGSSSDGTAGAEFAGGGGASGRTGAGNGYNGGAGGIGGGGGGGGGSQNGGNGGAGGAGGAGRVRIWVFG